MPLLPLIVSHNAEKLSRGGGLLMRAGAALWLHGQEGGRRCVEERRDAGAEPELEQRWAAQLAEALGCALRGRRARVATPLKKSLLSLPLIYGKSDSPETLVSSHQYDSPSFSVSWQSVETESHSAEQLLREGAEEAVGAAAVLLSRRHAAAALGYGAALHGRLRTQKQPRRVHPADAPDTRY